MSRARKNIASKIAGSSAGRAVIMKTLGEDGTQLVKAIKSSVSKNSTNDEAKKCKENIFKFAMKAKIMDDKKKFDQQKLEEAKKPILAYSRSVLNALDPNTEKQKVDFDDICVKYGEMTKKIQELMHPNMTQKNIDLLGSEINRLGNKNFLVDVVTKPDYADERKVFYECLHPILLVRDDLYALNYNTSLPNEKFSEQYKDEIEICKKFQSENKDDSDRIAMGVFNRLVESHNEYYNLIGQCIEGSDVEKQHELLFKCLNTVFESLDDWSGLREKLKSVGSSHKEQGPGLPLECYQHMLDAFHLAFSKLYPTYSTDITIRSSFHIILRLVCFILEQEF